jgi:hypothetical protein
VVHAGFSGRGIAMLDLFLGGIAAWFTIPAVIGTLYFLIQMLFQGIGGDADFDLDADFDTDVAHDGAGHDFRVLSLQTLSAFFMGGGWMGLAALRLLDLSPTMSALVAVGSGIAVGWLLITLLRTMLGLQNSGNIDLDDTVGLSGEVYVEVPETGKGSGRVKLIVNEHQREYHAVQEGQVAIPTGTPVRIVKVNRGSNTLSVQRA